MQPNDKLVALLSYLKGRRYRFTTVTPVTHSLVMSRPVVGPMTLRDIFGWNRAFDPDRIDADLLALMEDAEILAQAGGECRSQVRVASLGQDLFLHSAFPTDEGDSVFFGPDTYRFASFIARHLPSLSPLQVVDMGAGGGAGGISIARLAPAASITLVDTNARALELAVTNAKAAGIEVDVLQSRSIPPAADVIVANPPYMMDGANRAYRDGGDLYGGNVAREWTADALGKLLPGGAFLLYTGAAIVGGNAPLISAIEVLCLRAGASLHLEEIDPDVFSEELSRPQYADVERISVIGAIIRAAA